MIRMARQLTDKEKKKVVTEWVNGKSFNQIAREKGIAPSTVMKICNKEEEFKQKAMKKKEENTMDMLAFMDSRKFKAQELIDALLDGMLDKKQLDKSSLRDKGIVFGIVIDKTVGNTNNDNIDREIRVVFDDKDRTKPKD